MARPSCTSGLPPLFHLGHKRYLLEPASADAAHHQHDRAVGYALVAAHENLLVDAVLGDRLELFGQLVERPLSSRR